MLSKCQIFVSQFLLSWTNNQVSNANDENYDYPSEKPYSSVLLVGEYWVASVYVQYLTYATFMSNVTFFGTDFFF